MCAPSRLPTLSPLTLPGHSPVLIEEDVPDSQPSPVWLSRCASCGITRMSFNGPIETADCAECAKWLEYAREFFWSCSVRKCSVCGRSKPPHPDNGITLARMVAVLTYEQATADSLDWEADPVCGLCFAWARNTAATYGEPF